MARMAMFYAVRAVNILPFSELYFFSKPVLLWLFNFYFYDWWFWSNTQNRGSHIIGSGSMLPFWATFDIKNWL